MSLLHKHMGLWVMIPLLCTFLSGCYDRSELEEQAFLMTLGIDQLDAHHVAVMARVAVPSKIASSPSGGGGGGSDFASGTPLVSASGRGLHESLNLMNTGIERSINLSHLSAIIFSERAARQGLLPYLHTLVRYREFRRTLYVFIAKGNLADVFVKNRPVLETSITREMEDLHGSSSRTGYATTLEMHKLLGGLEAPGEDPALPILSYNEHVGSESKKTAGSIKHLRAGVASDVPGEVNRAGGNPMECIGSAVFQSDRMVGILDGEETRYMQLLASSLPRTTVTLPSPIGSSQNVTVGIKYARPIQVDVTLGHTPKIRIKQQFEAELLGDQTNAGFSSDVSRHILERAVANEIMHREDALVTKVFKKYHSDPFHFFVYARSQFASYEELEHFNWRGQLPKVTVDLQASVAIRRLGMQLNPPIAE